MSEQLKLICLRGLPGCGKSTFAKDWVSEDPAKRARVNRDDIRSQLHGSVYLGWDTEKQVTAVRDSMVRSLLKAGVSVIVDETALRNKTVKDIAKLANGTHAEFTVVDMTDVDINTCISRDRKRPKPVGESVIIDMFNRFIKGKAYPLPCDVSTTLEIKESEIYVPNYSLMDAFIIDVDGTIANMSDRNPYDWHRVSEDEPVYGVIDIVNVLSESMYPIFVSGRDSVCYDDTREFILNSCKYIKDFDLYMRAAGDMRPDDIVKKEIFFRDIARYYCVRLVLDDRNKVVRMWRNIGLTCFQVAEGDF